MTKKLVAIINYGSGNLRSVEKAFQKIIADYALNFDIAVTADTAIVQKASHIVLPGQGAFADCMAGLKTVPHMIETLENQVLKAKKPFLGICVGMQLLMDRGLEQGEHKGLGWIAGQVVPIMLADKALKIPHMGWNVLKFQKSHSLVKNQKKAPHFYFVHSFMVESKDKEAVLATVDYGDVTIPAIISKNNMAGIQCHPEKSQEAGLTFLHDFLLWNSSPDALKK